MGSQWWCVLVCPLTVACGLEDLDKPEPLEIGSVLAELEAPTGSLRGLAPERSAEVLSDVSLGIGLLCGFDPVADGECIRSGECRGCGALELLGDAVVKVAASIQEGDDQTDGGIERTGGAAGVLFVQRICNGWGRTPVPDPAHGRIEATIGFSRRRLDPVVWGTFEGCQLRPFGRRLQLDGEFFLAFEGEAVPRGMVRQVPVVFSYTGSVRGLRPDVTFELDAAVRMRLDRRGDLQLLTVGSKHGSFVWTLDNMGVSIEAANGRYVCDAEGQRCVRQDS